MKSKPKPKPVITRSPEALACLLRNGGGKHGDRRTKRNRTRATQKRAALSGW